MQSSTIARQRLGRKIHSSEENTSKTIGIVARFVVYAVDVESRKFVDYIFPVLFVEILSRSYFISINSEWNDFPNEFMLDCYTGNLMAKKSEKPTHVTLDDLTSPHAPFCNFSADFHMSPRHASLLRNEMISSVRFTPEFISAST
jgi:hypothetical protein